MSGDVQVMVQDIETARRERNWDAAIEKCFNLLEVDPENETACTRLAEFYAYRGLVSSVIHQYFNLIDILDKKQDFSRALKFAKLILRLAPDNDKARVKIIEIYRLQDNTEQVVKQTLTLARLYINLGHGEKSIKLLKSSLEHSPDNLELGMELAEIYVSYGNIPEGLNQYRKIANAYQAKGKHRRAAEAFRRIKVINPGDNQILFALGSLYLQLGRLDEAEQEFRTILRQDINHAEALMSLSNICQRKGQFRDAILALNKILSFNPMHEIAKEKLGDLFISQGATKEAVKSFLFAAQLHIQKENIDHAVRLFQKVISIDETNPTAVRELTNYGAPLKPDAADQPQDGAAALLTTLEVDEEDLEIELDGTSLEDMAGVNWRRDIDTDIEVQAGDESLEELAGEEVKAKTEKPRSRGAVPSAFGSRDSGAGKAKRDVGDDLEFAGTEEESDLVLDGEVEEKSESRPGRTLKRKTDGMRPRDGMFRKASTGKKEPGGKPQLGIGQMLNKPMSRKSGMLSREGKTGILRLPRTAPETEEAVVDEFVTKAMEAQESAEAPVKVDELVPDMRGFPEPEKASVDEAFFENFPAIENEPSQVSPMLPQQPEEVMIPDFTHGLAHPSHISHDFQDMDDLEMFGSDYETKQRRVVAPPVVESRTIPEPEDDILILGLDDFEEEPDVIPSLESDRISPLAEAGITVENFEVPQRRTIPLVDMAEEREEPEEPIAPVKPKSGAEDVQPESSSESSDRKLLSSSRPRSRMSSRPVESKSDVKRKLPPLIRKDKEHADLSIESARPMIDPDSIMLLEVQETPNIQKVPDISETPEIPLTPSEPEEPVPQKTKPTTEAYGIMGDPFGIDDILKLVEEFENIAPETELPKIRLTPPEPVEEEQEAVPSQEPTPETSSIEITLEPVEPVEPVRQEVMPGVEQPEESATPAAVAEPVEQADMVSDAVVPDSDIVEIPLLPEGDEKEPDTTSSDTLAEPEDEILPLEEFEEPAELPVLEPTVLVTDDMALPEEIPANQEAEACSMEPLIPEAVHTMDEIPFMEPLPAIDPHFEDLLPVMPFTEETGTIPEIAVVNTASPSETSAPLMRHKQSEAGRSAAQSPFRSAAKTAEQALKAELPEIIDFDIPPQPPVQKRPVFIPGAFEPEEMELISSRKNPAVKFVHQLHLKKYRVDSSSFVMEGFRSLQEILKTDVVIKRLYYSTDVMDRENLRLLEQLKSRSELIYPVTEDIMEYISPTEQSQKILAVLPQQTWDIDEVMQSGKYFVGLYQVRDPGNMGTIIRSARAFACGAIILIDDCVEPYNPKVVRSTAGYILTQPIIYISSLVRFSQMAAKYDLDVSVLSPDTDRIMQLHAKPEKRQAFLFGGEAAGFGNDIKNLNLTKYRIPMEPDVESLNLSVSASIIMANTYESMLKFNC